MPHHQSFPAFLAISVNSHFGQLKPLFSTIPIMFFISFPILSDSIQRHTIIIGCTKTYTKPPKPIKLIIKLYTHHNTLLVKYFTFQKVESLRAASFSKLDNKANSNSIFTTKRCKFFTKWQVILHFQSPICAYKYNLQQHPTIYVKYPFFYFIHLSSPFSAFTF